MGEHRVKVHSLTGYLAESTTTPSKNLDGFSIDWNSDMYPFLIVAIILLPLFAIGMCIYAVGRCRSSHSNTQNAENGGKSGNSANETDLMVAALHAAETVSLGPSEGSSRVVDLDGIDEPERENHPPGPSRSSKPVPAPAKIQPVPVLQMRADLSG